MDNQAVGSKNSAIMAILEEAMLILRDDKPLSKSDQIFGKLSSFEKSVFSNFGDEYKFQNEAAADADIKISTVDDPLNYADERAQVALVPSEFRIMFYQSHSLPDISPSMLKKHLDLADYWIDSHGEKKQGNDMGSGLPPAVRLHNYRFRANAHSGSRFPVDVDAAYIEPSRDALTPAQPRIIDLIIRRAYPYLTPEMRKQKRDDAAARARAAYGNGKEANQ